MWKFNDPFLLRKNFFYVLVLEVFCLLPLLRISLTIVADSQQAIVAAKNKLSYFLELEIKICCILLSALSHAFRSPPLF